ncbi:MAG: flagellar hook-associated protein FlgK, partial [Rhodospirillales bacterium]|nr:flagellar hook-associated protein FlgK [Rhodospirillales bacterium]
MSLNIALQTATSGLRAAQAGIEIVSRNVANAGIEGYTRKTLPLESLTVNGQSIGVRLGEITRSVNTRLQGEARIGFGLTESLRVKDDFLSRLDLILGTPGGTNSLSSVLGRLGDS